MYTWNFKGIEKMEYKKYLKTVRLASLQSLGVLSMGKKAPVLQTEFLKK